jgi:hypothetical protein
MKLRRLLCFGVRHRWVPSPDDSDEGVLILECARCGREQVFSDTFEMEGWLERWGRQEIAQSPYVNPRHSDPRFHERRP